VSAPFLGEIMITSFDFAPQGWALCNGQTLPISQNQLLFQLLGTLYGGNGQTTFALPDLRGQVPIHFGPGNAQGKVAGQRTHTLTIDEIPQHQHGLQGSKLQGNAVNPRPPNSTGTLFAQDPGNVYAPPPPGLIELRPGSSGNTGNSQPHDNMQPYLVLSFCIALQGDAPPKG
jgi:microcystin-dependent protein